MPTIRNPIEWSGAQLASAAHAAEAVGRSVDHMRQTAHSPAPVDAQNRQCRCLAVAARRALTISRPIAAT